MKKYILLFLLLASLSPLYSQKKRDRARANIVMLKEGALLVRLRTSELQIAGLKKMGKTEEAEKLQKEQDEQNKSIMLAFKEHYKFSKVYFFYSNNSALVTAGKLDGILFDADMNLYGKFSSNKFLVGEFDKSETTALDAFIIKDKNFDQLKAPFPYLTRLNQAFVSTRSNDQLVKVLDEKLHEFYGK